MSRFYNALKEASRWNPSAESGWEGLKPPADPAATHPPSAAAMSGAASGIESPAVLSLEHELNELSSPTPAAPDDRVFGSHADVVLDRTARLIPHAVDPSVVEHYRKL